MVESEVIRLARPRQGHFDLGTGYHGDVWLDLDALFLRPSMLRPHVRWLGHRLLEHRIDAVCGPMEGGAFLAQAIADLTERAFLAAYRSAAPRPGDMTAYRLRYLAQRARAFGPASGRCAREVPSRARSAYRGFGGRATPP